MTIQISIYVSDSYKNKNFVAVRKIHKICYNFQEKKYFRCILTLKIITNLMNLISTMIAVCSPNLFRFKFARDLVLKTCLPKGPQKYRFIKQDTNSAVNYH